MIKKKYFFSLIAFILLSSCQYFSYYDSIPIVKAAVFGFESQPVTEEEFQNNEFSFIVARLQKGKEARLVLSTVEESGIERWVGIGGIKIYTYLGKVIKTNGFDHDFEILDWNKIQPEKSTNLVLFSNPHAVFKQIVKLEEASPAQIDFHYEGKIISSYVREEVQTNKLSSINYNSYWRDSRGYIKRTNQFLNPKLPPITIDFFYKF
jgi:hypothetical protein